MQSINRKPWASCFSEARRGLQPRCLRYVFQTPVGNTKRFGRVYKTRPAEF
jgi:hypothetical protein